MYKHSDIAPLPTDILALLKDLSSICPLAYTDAQLRQQRRTCLIKLQSPAVEPSSETHESSEGDGRLFRLNFSQGSLLADSFAHSSAHGLHQNGSNGAGLDAAAQTSSLLSQLQAIQCFTVAASMFLCCSILHAVDAIRLLMLK